MNNIGITNFTREIVRMLVDGRYEELERMSKGIRLPAKVIEQAVTEYECTLVMPPSEAFEDLDVIEVENSNPRRFSVVADLYSVEEGESDLSLEMTLIENGTGFDVEIDGIHVL